MSERKAAQGATSSTLKTKTPEKSKPTTDQIEQALDSADEKPKKPSADYVVNDIAWHNTLFYDQYEEPWIAVKGSGSQLFQIGHRNKGFMRWLHGHYRQNYKPYSLKESQGRDIANALEGAALYEGKGEKRLETRACFIGDTLWYDLGKSAVRINKRGWQIVEDPPILFRRYSHQEKQVLPAEDGDIQALRQFVNMPSDNDWILFLTFLVSAFIVGSPKPALILTGLRGAGKTTPLRMLKKIVDPSELPSNGTPKKSEELARIGNRHMLLFFDNLSSLRKDVSDDLCRLITGDGFSPRTLYTNDDDTIFALKRAIMMNGINPFVTEADLLDRSLILEVERIAEDKRMAEDELWAKFEAERPKILGGVFSVISKALAIRPTVQADKLPRLADFYKWGLAINWAIGETMGDGDAGVQNFISAYKQNLDRQNDEALQASPTALAIIWLMEQTYEWCGSATQLLYDISYDRPDEYYDYGYKQWKKILEDDGRKHGAFLYYLKNNRYWPKDASYLSRYLNRAIVNLRAVGIFVEKFTENNKKFIRIYRRKTELESLGETAKQAMMLELTEAERVQMETERVLIEKEKAARARAATKLATKMRANGLDPNNPADLMIEIENRVEARHRKSIDGKKKDEKPIISGNVKEIEEWIDEAPF